MVLEELHSVGSTRGVQFRNRCGSQELLLGVRQWHGGWCVSGGGQHGLECKFREGLRWDEEQVVVSARVAGIEHARRAAERDEAGI